MSDQDAADLSLLLIDLKRKQNVETARLRIENDLLSRKIRRIA